MAKKYMYKKNIEKRKKESCDTRTTSPCSIGLLLRAVRRRTQTIEFGDKKTQIYCIETQFAGGNEWIMKTLRNVGKGSFDSFWRNKIQII